MLQIKRNLFLIQSYLWTDHSVIPTGTGTSISYFPSALFIAFRQLKVSEKVREIPFVSVQRGDQSSSCLYLGISWRIMISLSIGLWMRITDVWLILASLIITLFSSSFQDFELSAD